METDFTENMSQFLNAYIVCALWSTADDNGDALEGDFCKDDIDADSLMLMTVDCYKFYSENYAIWMNSIDCSQAGHDFWLTRNGHGTGFWDRGNGRAGELLSKRAQELGEVYLFIENNKVHYS